VKVKCGWDNCIFCNCNGECTAEEVELKNSVIELVDEKNKTNGEEFECLECATFKAKPEEGEAK
jgi:hypothetical protein